MARNKKSQSNGAAVQDLSESVSSVSSNATTSVKDNADANTKKKTVSAKGKIADSFSSALVICRNKHWRYISSYHGPWLQLPPEVLESLAHSNFSSPRPHPIDPAVFYDLVKIRKMVDEATNLAVRATSGVASSSLGGGNGMLNQASMLGLGINGNGGTAKLSRERKHRMRESATQKLSRAYHLDEIAASVATMQSASALEDVASLVLQRNEKDPDARYVHFFHEKIPSRMMAKCTSLQPLTQVIADRPGEAAPFRTRAVTRIFKEDFVGAAQDLTEGLAVARYEDAKHRAGRTQVELASPAANGDNRWNPRLRERDIKVDEDDQPTSIEAQMLFQRAGVYLTTATQHVHAALSKHRKRAASMSNGTTGPPVDGEVNEVTPAEKEAERKRLEARKAVKTNAKRAIRDYVAFLSHYDYTPGLPAEIMGEFLRAANEGSNGTKNTWTTPPKHRLLEMSSNSSLRNGHLSDQLGNSNGEETRSSENASEDLALVPRTRQQSSSQRQSPYATVPLPAVHRVGDLFAATQPADLPPYPPITSTALVSQKRTPSASATDAANNPSSTTNDSYEAISYHPLITDALHSLLLSHCLVQTSPKELLRHAHMAARLARVCDGYPIFLAARSPARADWIEVLRRTDNFIGLSQTWEALCAPAPLPGHQEDGKAGNNSAVAGAKPKETEEMKREKRRQEAIIEALADDRVVDEESFQKAVSARERRAEADAEKAALPASSVQTQSPIQGPTPPLAQTPPTSTSLSDKTTEQPRKSDPSKRWCQEPGDKEYPIGTERAEAIARWVREAEMGSVSGRSKKKGKKGRSKGGLASVATAGGDAGDGVTGLESSVASLDVGGKGDEGEEAE